MGEVFDHMLKRWVKVLLTNDFFPRYSFIQCHLLIVCVRMSYRRQKRWWNAYILFYERLDVLDQNRTIDVDRSKYMNRIFWRVRDSSSYWSS